jgi:hypothetical protein
MNPLQQQCCKGFFLEPQHNPVSIKATFKYLYGRSFS